MSEKRIVIYHAGCADGFCAAWLLWRVFPDAEFVPANYGDDPPDVAGKIVYVVDFSYPRDTLIQMHEQSASLVVLDHHRSAQQALADLPFCVFNMDKSGGRLTWEYIQSSIRNQRVTSCGELPPWIVAYTEDRDLWLWDLDESKAINACLRSYPMEFELWNSFVDPENPDITPESFCNEGRAILRDQALTVAIKAKQAHVVNVRIGDAEFQWNVANATTLVSETAGELAKVTGIGCCWFEKPSGDRVYSLRCDHDANFNLSAMARFFGGGGHRTAAGFTIHAQNPHPWHYAWPAPLPGEQF